MNNHVVFFKEPKANNGESGPCVTSNPYAQMCEKESWPHQFVPVLSFDFGTTKDKQALRDKLNDHARYAYLVFTSATALKACTHAFSPDAFPTTFLEKPVFVVGPATARAAVAAGFTCVCVPEDDSGNAKVLGPYIAGRMAHAREHENNVKLNLWDVGPREVHLEADKPGLLLLARMRLPTLTTILTAAGEPHEEVFCYDTVPATSLWYSLAALDTSTPPTSTVHALQHQPLLSSSLTLDSTCACTESGLSAASALAARYGVLFSPSGVTSLLSHIDAALVALRTGILPSGCESWSQCVSAARAIVSTRYVAIGDTTARALVAQTNALTRVRTEAAELLSIETDPALHFTDNASHNGMDTTTVSSTTREQLAKVLLRAQLQLVATCATPDPAGVRAALLQTITSTNGTNKLGSL